MMTFLGFLELAAWLVAVVALVAGVTYIVVKVFPGRDDRPATGEPAGGQTS